VVNRNWEEGIASSIRAGVERLPGSCNAVMLMLGDQLGVTGADLKRLADAWRRQPQYIVAAQYSGATGVPAIFPRSEFGALLQLRGDRGAQALLRRAPERVITVPLAGGALDIDTPEDLQRAVALQGEPTTERD
jgi:molybdenum cofactor cytidylyltransferase